jgi:hypothetical protein
MKDEINFILNSNEEELAKNLEKLSLVNIIKHKKNLTIKFIIKYLLDEKYYGLSEEYDIDILMILKYQNHITFDQLTSAIEKED